MSVVPVNGKTVAVEGVASRSMKLMKGPLPYIDVFIKAMPDIW